MKQNIDSHPEHLDKRRPKFSILITTKNRKPDLIYTLDKIKGILERKDVECILFDDGSNDGTFDYIAGNYPEIKLFRNEESKGLIHCRNMLLSETKADFAISIDDDLHFLSQRPLETIEAYFNLHPKCGLISFRIFWSKTEPESNFTTDQPVRVKSFPGGANAWRLSAWKEIPNYPAWFIFHGEEDFAAYNLFKKSIEIHYVPEILTNHRVDIKGRKKDADYGVRLRKSLRSGWYLYFLFLPLQEIPKKMAYSIWVQLKQKVFKGDFAVLKALFLAFFDLMSAIPKIIKDSNRLTSKEYADFLQLENAKIYWKPENNANFTASQQIT